MINEAYKMLKRHIKTTNIPKTNEEKMKQQREKLLNDLINSRNYCLNKNCCQSANIITNPNKNEIIEVFGYCSTIAYGDEEPKYTNVLVKYNKQKEWEHLFLYISGSFTSPSGPGQEYTYDQLKVYNRLSEEEIDCVLSFISNDWKAML